MPALRTLFLYAFFFKSGKQCVYFFGILLTGLSAKICYTDRSEAEVYIVFWE